MTNIFNFIGWLFKEVLFKPFNFLRLDVESWWVNNAFNWVFVFILIALLAYWIGQSLKFKREGTED